MAVTQAKDRYYLRTLHEEISLYDRKLAHLMKYDSFASDGERDKAAQKLNQKRDLLVRNARELVEQGIEYRVAELPRSLRTPEQLAVEAPAAPVARKEAAVAVAPPPPPTQETTAEPSYQGTALDFRNEIKEYVAKRRNASQGQAVPALSH